MTTNNHQEEEVTMDNNTTPEQEVNVFDEVKTYSDHGFLTTPVTPGKKKTPAKGTTGRQVTPEEKRVNAAYAWETAPGNANVALSLLPGFVGLDVDHYEDGSKQGWIHLQELFAEHGLNIDDYPWDEWPRSSRRGVDSAGVQFFFRVPEDLEYASNPCTDVEIVQPAQRYAMVWPSKVDGMQYRWYIGNTETGIPFANELPELPAELIPVFARGPVRSAGSRVDEDSLNASLDWLEGRVFGGESQAELPDDVHRYDPMRDTVMSLVSNAVHNGHAGLMEALKEIRERREAYELAARNVVSDDYAGTVTSAVAIAKAEIASDLKPDVNWRERFGAEPLSDDYATPNYFERLAGAAKKQAKKAKKQAKKAEEAEEAQEDDGLAWGPSDTGAILSGEAVRREPELLQMTDGSHLLYRGKVHNVYAPSETGKSWFMFAAAASVLKDGGHVLHIDAEMDVFDCIENLRRLGVPDEYLTTEHYWHIADMDNPTIDTHSLKRWEYLLEAKTWDLVLMDSVGQLMGGMDNNSSSEYREWHRHMPNKARLKGLTVVMIDHISKTQELAGNIGHPEGTTNKKNQADVTIYLRKVGDGLEIGKVGELEILITKDRFGSLRKAGVTGYKGFKCRGWFRLDSTDRNRSEWSFVSSQDASAVGFKAVPSMAPAPAPAGVLDSFSGSIGEINTALLTFLDPEGTGVTRSVLMQAWETYAPAALARHGLTKVERSESGLKNENRRLTVKLSSRLLAEEAQGTIKAMISALAETV